MPPIPPVAQPTGVTEVEGAEGISTTKPFMDAKITEIGEFDQSSDRPLLCIVPSYTLLKKIS